MLIGTRQLLLRLPVEMSLIMSLRCHLTYDDHITKTISSFMAKLCQIYRVKDSFAPLTFIMPAMAFSLRFMETFVNINNCCRTI
jgi:hypothetical protein